MYSMDYVLDQSRQMYIEDGNFDNCIQMGYHPAEGDYYYFMRNVIFPNIDIEPFLNIYPNEQVTGRRRSDVRVCLCALLLAEHEHMELDHFAYHLKTNAAYQYALYLNLYNARIPSYSVLRNFRQAVNRISMELDIDPIHDTFVSTTRKVTDLLGIEADKSRIDGFLLEIKAKVLTRYELIYVCTGNFIKELAEKDVPIEEQLRHFLDPGDKNIKIYHDRDTTEEAKIDLLLADAELAVSKYAQTYDSLASCKVLLRCLHEQTIQSEDGKRHLRQKGDPVLSGKPEATQDQADAAQSDVSLSSDTGVNSGDADTIAKRPILQTPVDPDATFNGKRGENHRGYAVAALEGVTQYGGFIEDYAFGRNIRADNALALEIAERAPYAEHGKDWIGDAAFAGDALVAAAAEKNIRIVNTNLSGRKTSEIFADLQFAEDGRTVTACPNGIAPERTKVSEKDGSCTCWFDCSRCAECSFREECHPTEQKKACKRTFTSKQKTRALSMRSRGTEEFVSMSHCRNGVECLGSLLRRAYGIDKLEARGFYAFRNRTGLILLALNIQKLFAISCRKAAEEAKRSAAA